MGLYQTMELEDCMSVHAIRRKLDENRQIWRERIRTGSPKRDEYARALVYCIDTLDKAASHMDPTCERPLLAVKTLCCALESNVSDYERFEEAVLWIINKRIFKSDYRDVIEFLESMHQDDLVREWNDFEQQERRNAAVKNRKKNTAQKKGNSKREGKKPSSRFESFLGVMIVGIAVLIAVGIFFIVQKSTSLEEEEISLEEEEEEEIGFGQTLFSDEEQEDAEDETAQEDPVQEDPEEEVQETAEEPVEDTQVQTFEESVSGGLSDYTLLTSESAFPTLTQVAYADAYASSVLVSTSGASYAVESAFDDDLTTSWQEGEEDEGLGASLVFSFESTVSIKGIAIWGGTQTNEELYEKNNRPSAIRIETLSGDSSDSVSINLEDVNGAQMILFSQAVPTSDLILTIEGVYMGSEYNDTAISELKFYTE